jgi:hypothetical protein
VAMVARAMLSLATAMLASADTAMFDEDAVVAVGDLTDANIVHAQAVTGLDKFDEDEAKEGVTLAGFTTLSMSAPAAYVAIQRLSTVLGGIIMGIGTTEGTVAGINLGPTGSFVGNPANAPHGSVTVTNATVTSIDNGIAKETTVTPPDSITVTPAGVVSFNPGA